MPCACGQKTTAQVWDFIAENGVTTTYTTEIQARAAVVRANGGKVVARAK